MFNEDLDNRLEFHLLYDLDLDVEYMYSVRVYRITEPYGIPSLYSDALELRPRKFIYSPSFITA
jgi:hypothetical protein